MAVLVDLYFEAPLRCEVIESSMDETPKLGDRFTIDGGRWQVYAIFPDEDPVHVHLHPEDAPPRA